MRLNEQPEPQINKIYQSIFFATLISYIPPANAQCAPNPPNTGLGSCIDFMAATSISETNQIHILGYKFAYAAGSYIDYKEKTIYIKSYDCENPDTLGLYTRLSLLSHELGHAEYGVKQDTTSREAYIKSWCDSEGYAVINNIRTRSETLICSTNSVDIGLAASNAAELLNINSAGRERIQKTGEAFCKNNFTSTTKQNYIDYYGSYYNAHY